LYFLLFNSIVFFSTLKIFYDSLRYHYVNMSMNVDEVVSTEY
jgi:hypothetical protein